MSTHSFAFPPQCRLKKPDDFKRVFAQPIKSSDSYFTLLALPNDLGHARLGLAIAKKQVRKAVQRNRLKRTVRENFRQQQHRLSALDIVVLARKEAVDVPSEVLRQSLTQHWLRLHKRCAAYSSP